MNEQGQVFWAKRVRQVVWQFPQGGLQSQETSDGALWRELREETGLKPNQVHLLNKTKNWLYYKIPPKFQRERFGQPLCIGQKQIWYLLQLKDKDTAIDLSGLGHKQEFDDWKWVNYWYPLYEVVPFKREIYRRALMQLRSGLYPAERGLDFSLAHYTVDLNPLDPFL